MKKVGVVSIDLSRLKGRHGLSALSASGNNSGNMLFTSAAYNQIKNCLHIGFNFDPVKTRANYDAILIPAANWINTSQDWGGLGQLLKETDLPVTIVGLGAQLDSLSDHEKIPMGTKDFLRTISGLCETIGVRGEFTANVLKELGINNVEVLGCPSIFAGGKLPNIRTNQLNSIKRIGIGPTRYDIPKISAANMYDKQRLLYQFGLASANSLYLQSEAFEISLLNRENLEGMSRAVKYYGVNSKELLIDKLMIKGKFHTDLDHWISDVMKEDLFIGTRIHGVIAATLAGTPAVLITHDERTRELADTMAVPNISIENFRLESLYSIDDFVALFDFEKFMRRAANNYIKLKKFYKLNSLESNL